MESALLMVWVDEVNSVLCVQEDLAGVLTM